ncbi:MAG: NAD-dependent succinate-semialdehyde dehydrogenase [Microcoleaceae cyanobacterium]
MGIATINPATGELLRTFEPLNDTEIENCLESSAQTFQQYRQIPLTQRSQCMLKVADILETDAEKWAKIMTEEMGKPLKSAIAEVKKSAWVCRFYAENAADFLADTTIQTDASRSFVRYQPIGPILAVMPWNFPFWQVFRFAAPALMAGNVGLLKHASNVPQCAIAIAEIFKQAGFAEGVFQTLLIGAKQVAKVIEDERVKAGTLTGSEPAGASLASLAGQHIKKTVLELGGSDPFVVLSSANVDQAVSAAVTARMLNNGQSCIAAKRFILAEEIADQFIQQLVEKFSSLKVGDPTSLDTDIGPLATPDILQELDGQVQACKKVGANILIGGEPLSEQKGNFYPPTIVTNIPEDAPIAQEEFFGPVALVFRVSSIDEAIKLANNTPFGLGASAWTTDPAEIERLMSDLEAGAVFINSLVKSDPRLPFGGIKRSGYGRELSIQGMHEFLNIKTVWVK